MDEYLEENELPEKIFKEFHEFFNKYEFSRYSDLSNSELFNLDKLSLSGMRMDVIPFKLIKIDYLPTSIRYLKNLKSVILRYNNFSSIPEELSELDRLEFLNISENPLKSVPNVLPKLSNLKKLYISDIQVDNFPDDMFSQLRKLELLNLRNNRLTSLPESLKDVNTLKEIWLMNNSLKRES